MRILAIGDIHGCSTALANLLALIDLQPEDKLITLGDYVDKGPNSKRVLEILIELDKTGQLIALRGNHEITMLAARERKITETYWRRSGGELTLASYAKTAELSDVPLSHWEFLEHKCLDYWETDTHLFIHASVYPEQPLLQQPPHILFWGGFEDTVPHISGKKIVCGHTTQTNGYPLDLGFAICIDTWVDGQGWLTCLDVEQQVIWQTNQKGEARISELSGHSDILSR